MLNSIKASIKDTLIFGFGNVSVKIIGLVLIPLYTNPDFFSVDDFGMIGLLDISGMVLISILATSLPQSLSRWYWANDKNTGQKEVFFMTFMTQVVLSALFCILLIPLSGTFSDLVFGKAGLEKVISLIIISSALQGINNIVNTLLRLQTKSFLFMATNLVKLTIVLLITIWLITARGMGLEGIYLAQVVGNLLLILILMPYTIRNCKPAFNRVVWSEMMAYGFPLVIAAFATVMLNVIDRYALNSLALLKFVAIYTLAFKISSSLKLVVVDTIRLAVFPRMIKRLDSPDNKRFYSKAMLYSSFAVMLAIIGVSLFSLEAVKLLSKTNELWTAWILVPVLSLSTFFMNMREVSVYGLIATKKTQKISSIVIVSTLLGLGLNLLLIPIWNAMGAALATLISQLFYWVLMHITAQRNFHVPYENGKLLLIFITGSVLSMAGLLFNGMDLFPRLVVKILCLAAFPFVLYLMKFYEPVELEAIKGFAKKWSDPGKLKENIRSLGKIGDDM